ncbi:hypothetical protein PANO111632_08175 [Paracoccus nototheniae]|uniref:CpsD/CapB family tyrosine-protein kinase n=1 Tax=Paracoccus nototheniae TaxID=2489002 RepID=A0ABW4DW86_9RHOB|nr:hypothetical protein [Paracoccus nototheniae]
MDGAGSGYQNERTQGWAEMPMLALPQKAALRAAIADDKNPERAEGYDLLRTRILAGTAAQDWTRIGITQAKGSALAAPLTALNLALSEARRPARRVVLIDLDIARQPVLARLGAAPPTPRPGRGAVWHGQRLTDRLALLTIAAPAVEAATLLLSEAFQADLMQRLASLAPDITILHLPAMLAGDAGLAALPLCQTVLLAIDGRADTAPDLRACERRIGETRPILGLFLHDAEV